MAWTWNRVRAASESKLALASLRLRVGLAEITKSGSGVRVARPGAGVNLPEKKLTCTETLGVYPLPAASCWFALLCALTGTIAPVYKACNYPHRCRTHGKSPPCWLFPVWLWFMGSLSIRKPAATESRVFGRHCSASLALAVDSLAPGPSCCAAGGMKLRG